MNTGRMLMNAVLPLLLAAAFASAAAEPAGNPAERVVGEFRWDRPGLELPVNATAIRTNGDRTTLVIRRTNENSQIRVALLRIEAPAIAGQQYAIRGQVRYSGVKGKGFLELWNYFPPLKPGQPEGAYFSRTLGESGSMGVIAGDSDWREFLLPFNRTGAPAPPSRLELTAILPTPCEVELGPLQLVDYADDAAGAAGAWWSREQTGSIGAALGALGGILGGLIGPLAGQRRARGLVLGALALMGAAGALGLFLGFRGLAANQPFWVWGTLVLSGGLMLAIPGTLFIPIRRRYAELELRRISSLDASGT